MSEEMRFPNKPKEPKLSKDDQIIKDAIDVIEERGWTGQGWEYQDRVCILGAVNIAKGEKHAYGSSTIPINVLRRIHQAIFADGGSASLYNEGSGYFNKEMMLSSSIIRWNDSGLRSGRRRVIKALKTALTLDKKEKK